MIESVASDILMEWKRNLERYNRAFDYNSIVNLWSICGACYAFSNIIDRTRFLKSFGVTETTVGAWSHMRLIPGDSLRKRICDFWIEELRITLENNQ